MIKALRKFFNTIPIATLVQDNLEEHHRLLLEQQSKAAYHSKMAEYYEEGINRLAGHLSLKTKKA